MAKLTGSRAATNGPITIRLRELARWIIDGEKRSLPEPTCDPDGFDLSGGSA